MPLNPSTNGRHESRLDTLQSIELAEGVEIHLRMAGPYVRVFAYLLDLLIRIGVLIVTGLLLKLMGFIFGFDVMNPDLIPCRVLSLPKGWRSICGWPVLMCGCLPIY